MLKGRVNKLGPGAGDERFLCGGAELCWCGSAGCRELPAERLGGELFRQSPVSSGGDGTVPVATFLWGCFFRSHWLLAQEQLRRGFLSSSAFCVHSPETELGAALRRATNAPSGSEAVSPSPGLPLSPARSFHLLHLLLVFAQRKQSMKSGYSRLWICLLHRYEPGLNVNSSEKTPTQPATVVMLVCVS